MFVDSYHSRVCFVPGTLKLWGRDVRSVSWQTSFSDSNQALWNLFDSWQETSVQVGADAFIDALSALSHLTLARFSLRTQLSQIDVEPASGDILVTWKDGQTFSCRAVLRFDGKTSETVQAIRTALFLADAEDDRRMKNRLAKMMLLGIIRAQI